jgi:putative hemolysin
MLDHKIDLMFGCASLHGTDMSVLSKPLSYLHHYHLSPDHLRPVAVSDRYVDMNIFPKEDLDPKRSFIELPPLIKGYLRLGAKVGQGAVHDHQFNTTDVCIVLKMSEVSQKYRDHYTRKHSRFEDVSKHAAS